MRVAYRTRRSCLFKLIPVFAAGLAVAGLAGCNKGPAATEGKKGGKKGGEVVPVAVATVVTRDVPVDIEVIGNVEAYSTVAVKSRVTGPIEKVHFKEGDFVRKGAVLFSIDPAPFQAALSQAEANLARDKAQLLQAQANLSRDMAQQAFLASQAQRFGNLQKEGVISKDQAEQQQASADVAAQSVNAGKAAIASAQAAIQAGEAAVKTARIMLGYTTVTSPIDGRTGPLVAREGTLATANITELIAISQVQPIYVTFAVPESQLSTVKDAMGRGRLPVTVAPPDDPANPETGTLTFIDSSVDQNTGTIRLKAQFDNPRRKLWPGQFVRVRLRLGLRPNARMVPNQAVQTGQDGSFVYRVTQDSRVEVAPVQTAGRVGDDIVIGSGLEPGDVVVTEGQLRLAPGSRIRTREQASKGGAKGGGGPRNAPAEGDGAGESKAGIPKKGKGKKKETD